MKKFIVKCEGNFIVNMVMEAESQDEMLDMIGNMTFADFGIGLIPEVPCEDYDWNYTIDADEIDEGEDE